VLTVVARADPGDLGVATIALYHQLLGLGTAKETGELFDRVLDLEAGHRCILPAG
jgi:hypothetical protein